MVNVEFGRIGSGTLGGNALRSGCDRFGGARITLRPRRPSDRAFIFEVFRSTREHEMVAWGWREAERAEFLAMQFEALLHSRASQFASIDDCIVLLNNLTIGRLATARTDHEIRIVDLAVLPPYRNLGIGSRLVSDLIAEASISGKPVCLHVLKASPAVRLYERLGFERSGGVGVHLEMRWSPAESESDQPPAPAENVRSGS